MAAVVICAGLAAAQGTPAPPPPPGPGPAAQTASISFLLESAHRDPPRISLTIDLLGHATYVAEEAPTEAASAGPSAPSASAAPYRVLFDIAPNTRDRIFALAQALDYFSRDFEFRKHRVADTGLRTFRYRDAVRQGTTAFHWSENKLIEELAGIFESIALTQDYARRLTYLRKYDKLGLDANLKRMEELEHAGFLGEIQAIAPTLRQIAADPTVMHVARERAQRFLDRLPPAEALASPAGESSR
ncbi:MAG: hypothetical protein HYX28_00965 [Candidatus Koribacter versatilis]|uniref:Uncharacterized protein n=1 Tax=Candidatus Korobacter versatilis TaxID=658062 RepID=A0A932A608_9BACT|nr:hypothetical protein [Candidatus Koribacter versatilis]